MAELLIKATSASHPDPEKDLDGCYKKGDLVLVMPDDHRWGLKEGPPKFVIVKVPGIARETVFQYLTSWKRHVDFEVVSVNTATGVYQIRIRCINPGASGAANLTRDNIETYLNNWGATVDSVSVNQVTFTLRLWQTLQSNGFWDFDVSGVSFDLVDYTNPIATVDVELPGISIKKASDRIVENAGVVVSDNGVDQIRFTIDRSDVLAAFQTSIKDKVEDTFTRRKYYFSEADVDTALSMGGVIELTAGQVTSRILSKLDL